MTGVGVGRADAPWKNSSMSARVRLERVPDLSMRDREVKHGKIGHSLIDPRMRQRGGSGMMMMIVVVVVVMVVVMVVWH